MPRIGNNSAVSSKTPKQNKRRVCLSDAFFLSTANSIIIKAYAFHQGQSWSHTHQKENSSPRWSSFVVSVKVIDVSLQRQKGAFLLLARASALVNCEDARSNTRLERSFRCSRMQALFGPEQGQLQ